MDWFFEFPEMERSGLRDFKKSIDHTFREFSSFWFGLKNYLLTHHGQ